MNCKDMAHLLSAYADGELGQTQKDFVENHLKSCAECQASLAEQQRLGKQLTALRVMPTCPDLSPKILGRIKMETKPKKSSSTWRPVLAAIPVAVVLVIALVFNLPGGSKMITAEELVQALLQNTSQITSYRSDGVTITTTTRTDGVQVVLETKTTNLVDLSSQRSYMDTTTTGTGRISIPDNVPVRVESFYQDGWQYKIYHTPYKPSNTEQDVWYKTKMADEYWANMFPSTTGNSDSLIALLYDNPKVTIIGSEAINGIDCYKIKIDADSEPLLTMFKEQGIIDPRFTGWVDKNTFHLLKSEHGFSSTRDGIVTEQSAVFFYSQINQVNITLPPEALNAPPPPAPPPPATPPQP